MSGNLRAIEIVVKLLKEHNIRYIVISPGGTNIAFIKKVQDDSFFKCYSIVDERSAMYFAIGLYLKTGQPIATSCTSAQATRNYIPGLTEAYYKHAPILAITMQKHERFIGQEYMQAPNQSSLPADCVKKSFVLPYISDINDEYYAIRMANEAILELNHNGVGPVQLCVQWLDFGIKEIEPVVRTINRYNNRLFPKTDISSKRIMIVIGEHRPFSEKDKIAIEKFSKNHDCVVYTNHLSNYKGAFSVNVNVMLTAMSLEIFVKELAPDIIISIGGQTGDYPLYLLLSKPELRNTEHWRICEDGDVVDTYDKITAVMQLTYAEFFNHYADDNCNHHDYYNCFKQLEERIDIDVDIPFSNAYVAQTLHDKIPTGSVMHFSILHSLRIWNLFPIDRTIQCYSNVGAFGIDGGLSTFLGESVVTDSLCFMIIGDLAFYYDMNCLAIKSIKNNVRILLVNNNGGVEFKLNYQDHSKIDRYIAAAGHFKNAKGWSETCGFKYICATSKEEFNSQYMSFLKPSEKPILFELFVSDENEFRAYDLIKSANQSLGFKDSVKVGIKRLMRK